MRLRLGEEDTDYGFGTDECYARRIQQTGRYPLFQVHCGVCQKIMNRHGRSVLTWFTRVRHEEVRTQVFYFVLVNLHLDDGSGSSSVSSYNHVALSSQCKRCLHVVLVVVT